jgi:rRNA-processing protein FCF1
VRAAVEAGRLDAPVVLVLEGAARAGAEEGESAGVRTVHAPGEGDDTLAALAEDAAEPVTLVSADRALAAQVRRLGVDVVGPTWLLDRLGPP